MWIDCNVHVEAWHDVQRINWIERARDARIEGVMWSGTHPAQWSAPNPEGFARAFGLHPLWVHPDTLADDLAQLFTRLSDTSSAVGEVGLDRRAEAPLELQLQALAPQLQFATTQTRALILHVVRAHEPLLSMLKELGVTRFMVHGFNGSPELARRYVDCGGLLGIGGLLTRHTPRLHEVIRQLPLSAFVLESDAPDLPPRGAVVSDPTDLPNTGLIVAQLKGCTVLEVARQTRENALTLFGLPIVQSSSRPRAQ